jgi:chlorobactene glucosyltransferase
MVAGKKNRQNLDQVAGSFHQHRAVLDWCIPLVNYRRSVILSLLSLPVGLVAERNFRSLPRLQSQSAAGQLPALSIIIPARDEEQNLQGLLPSLLSLAYPGQLEILLVDDHSTDSTRQVAADFGVSVLRLEQELPQDWKGKPYACHQGAISANGEWLLFTDADTVHAPESVSSAVFYALQANLDGLSLFLKHQPVSWLDNLALDTAFAGLFASWHASKFLLNGQFILVRRDVYFNSGGFASVRGEMLEDVALGNLLRSRGYRFQIMNAASLARVRMYRSSQHMFLGLSRLGSGVLGWQGLWAGLTTLYITGLVSPLVVLVGVIRGSLKWFWLPVSWGSAALSLLPWSRRSGSGWMALLAPLGGLVILFSALLGLSSRISKKGIPWKGRRV